MNVRFREKSGRHLLGLSFSGFDPKRTSNLTPFNLSTDVFDACPVGREFRTVASSRRRGGVLWPGGAAGRVGVVVRPGGAAGRVGVVVRPGRAAGRVGVVVWPGSAP